jgi:phospholipid-binding lipoprotein MlaA
LLRRSLALAVCAAFVGGAAVAQPSAPPASRQTVAVPSSAAPGPNPDPWEHFNREVFGLFQAVDRNVLRPAALGYQKVVPNPVRIGLHNVLVDVGEPVVFVNDVLQLHGNEAAVTLGRFVMNSTVGVAGLIDVATPSGMPHHDNGFGNTLGRYGSPPGPYVFLIGPSDVRDLIGSGVDILTDPLTWIDYTGRTAVSIGRGAISTLDARANSDQELQQVYSMATDPYASLRSLYLQNRQAQITGGHVDVNALPSFDDTPGGPPNATGAPGAPPATLPAPGVGGDAAALPGQTAPGAGTSEPPADSGPSSDSSAPPAAAPPQ